MKKHSHSIMIFLQLLLLLSTFLTAVSGHSHVHSCKGGHDHHHHHHEDSASSSSSSTRKLKIVGIVAILVSSALGVLVPILGKWVPALSPEKDVFFVIKAFAAGVILATAMVHILPSSFGKLGSDCLDEDPWRKFSFPGFIAMMAAVGTLAVDAVATGYYTRRYSGEEGGGGGEEDGRKAGDGNAHVHAHPHAHGMVHSLETFTVRQRIVAQVLEVGIVVHSVIIGMSVGTSQSLSTIKPLIAALCFHQFFEGMGLGSCIAQAKFKANTVVIMGLFFSLTTPIGVAVGMGVSSSYDGSSTTALIVEGVLDASAAGILVYMALVDLLAVDFMSERMQKSVMLQFLSYVGLLLGIAAMSILAKWA